MAELPSGTVTFLFTDIERSTRLSGRLCGRYAEVLAEHQRLLRAAFDAHDRREIHIRLLLELEPGVEPIAGILRQPPDGSPNPFTGRLQLTPMLEAIRRPAADDQLEGAVE